MKIWLKHIWTDPVWSKVISAGIIAFIGVLCSLVKGCFGNMSLLNAFKWVFNYKINIWLILGFALGVLIIRGIIKKYKDCKKTIPMPPFVNEFTTGFYQNQIWKWRWRWNPAEHYYYIEDLNIECPNCRNGILNLEYMDYRCSKCNTEFPFNFINCNHDSVRQQILDDARTKYDYCLELIGEMSCGAYKN